MSKIDKNGNIDITPSNQHLKNGVVDGSFREVKHTSSRGNTVGIFKIIILFLIFVVFYRFLVSGVSVDFSFKSFIDILSNAPSINFGLTSLDLTINGSWYPFNFVRDFINLNISVVEFGITLVSMLWQGLTFLFYIVRSLFVI